MTRCRIYKSGSQYFLLDDDNNLLTDHESIDKSLSLLDVCEKIQNKTSALKQEFYLYYINNRDDCSNLIGKLQIRIPNFHPINVDLFGLKYYTEFEILMLVFKLIRIYESKKFKVFEDYHLKVVTFYDLHDLKRTSTKKSQYRYTYDDLKNAKSPKSWSPKYR